MDRPIAHLSGVSGAELAAPFMYHCHLLEHEDKGMMGQFVVREQPVMLPMVTR